MEKILNLLKSRSTLTTILALLIFAALSWAYFYPDDVMGNVLQQHDVTQGVANGQEVKEFKATTGEVSYWTNSLFSGMPTFQISPSYDSTSLLSVVNKVLGLGFPSPVNLLFIMMVGFFILMLAFDVKWYIAVLGAIAYAFSSYFFILIGAGHIWKYVTLAYIPPTIAGIVWAYRGKVLSGSAIAALFAAVQISWNHVQMTYYFLFVIVAIAVAYLVMAVKNKTVKQWLKATGALAVAGVLAVAANAPNLYNTYAYSKLTMRGGHSELATASANSTKGGLDKDYITAWSYGKAETFTLLVPNVAGGATIKPEKGSNRLMSTSETPQAQKMIASGEISQNDAQVLSQFPQYFGDQPMTNGPVYVGALILALFLLGCYTVKGPLKWCLLVVTIFTVLLSWGHNFMWLTDLMIDHFPMYNKFRTVASILVVAEFTIPLIAMLALQQMITDPNWKKKYFRAFLWSMGVCIALCLLFYFVPSLFSLYSQSERQQFVETGVMQQYPSIFAALEAVRQAVISADALRSLIVLVLGAAVLYLFIEKKIKAQYAMLAVALITLVDLYTVNKRYLNTDSFATPVENRASLEPRDVDKQILADTAINYRVLDQPRFSDAAPSYYHKHIGGYHAAKLTRYQDLIDYQISKGNPEVMNMLNTKYVIVDDNQVYLNDDALGNAWFVDTLNYVATPNEEMAALTTIHAASQAVADKQFESVLGAAQPIAPGDTIYETTYAPNRLTYCAKSAKGGVAVFSEIFFPWGWKATIDGEEAPIGRVNYVLRALKVPAGHHTIEFSFEPQSVKATDAVATIAIVIIYILLLVALNVSVYYRICSTKCAAEDAEKK